MDRKGETAAVNTLDRLAELLGVSRATVSNAYNRPDQLSAQLRERILAKARELGYPGPNPAARALVRGRTGTIGVAFTETLSYAFSDPAAVSVLQGLAQIAERASLGLQLLPMAAGYGDQAAAALNATVDGFVIYSMPDDDPVVHAALERGLPTVFVDHPYVDGYLFVGIDDHYAAEQAASHMLELGHQHLGVIAYRPGPGTVDGPVSPGRMPKVVKRTAGARLPGYLDALRRAGRDPEHVPIHERAENTPAAGYAATRALLADYPTLTALLIDSDQLALGALQAARDAGVDVPDQLSVVGIDDIPGAANAIPPLTTVRQPLFDKGLIAGRLLLEGATSAHGRTVFLETNLVLRNSTAAPTAERKSRS